MNHVKKISAFQSIWEAVVTYVLIALGVLSVFAFGQWWFQIEHIPDNFSGTTHVFDVILFVLLTFVVWYQIVNEVLTWDLSLKMKAPVPMKAAHGQRVALLTAFVPGKEPYEILECTLKALVEVKYPHDSWVLDEGDDDEVKRMCHVYGVHHYTRKGIDRFNTTEGKFKAKTKGGNYNSWFEVHSYAYDIVAQHDVDFVPSKEFLMKTLGYFKDPEIAFVGTPQIYGNVEESWIARGAAEQAYGFYGISQKSLFGHDMQLFIGANHVIRVSAHNDITGYAGHIVEDHLTGMRLYSKRWKSVYVPEVLLVGEGPATWDAYFSQQMRWGFGLMDILFRHSPRLFTKMRTRHVLRYFLLQQYYFSGLAQFIGLLLISGFFLFGIQSTDMDLDYLLVYYLLFVIAQLVIFLWLQRFYIKPTEESGLHIPGKLLNIAVWPIYLIAFFSALVGKKLSYEVTPKGSLQRTGEKSVLSSFVLHFVFGTLSAVGLIVAYYLERAAPFLIFWAVTNTLFMYSFVLLAIFQPAFDNFKKPLSKISFRLPSYSFFRECVRTSLRSEEKV